MVVVAVSVVAVPTGDGEVIHAVEVLYALMIGY
jgi:hypothetical protein